MNTITLLKEEKIEYFDILRSHFATLKLKPGQFSKYLPCVFTEQSVAMLAIILKYEVSIFKNN